MTSDDEKEECDVNLMILQAPTFACPNYSLTVLNTDNCNISYAVNGSKKQKSNSFKSSSSDKLLKVLVFNDDSLIIEKTFDNECYQPPSCDEARLKSSAKGKIKSIFSNPDNSDVATKLMKLFASPSKPLVNSNNGKESIDLYLHTE